MRLADFILAHLEPILAEWEVFARKVWPGGDVDPLELRDHAADILRATAHDMRTAQTAAERSDKSMGDGADGRMSRRIDGASDDHAIGRVQSGFDLPALVAEYRALRASVIRLWRASLPGADAMDLDDLTRFNESIDQSLTEAVRSYTERVERSRQMFLAILGHDLRNPLSAMSMSAQLLPRVAKLDPASAKVAARIVDSADAMARMIDDLLDFTGIGLGAAMPLTRVDADLNALCREVADETRAGHPQLTLRVETTGDLTGSWDAPRLRQVLSNLLGNAAQHGAGAVDLRAGGGASGVVVTVRNGGAPIPPEAIATLFDPLVRGNSPEAIARRRPGSIGLGLYIARAVATAHGGTLDVASSPEAGTTFTLRLPRTARGAAVMISTREIAAPDGPRS